MKVLNIRCHVGAQIGAQVFTSIDTKSQGYDLEFTNDFGGGVFVTGKGPNGKTINPTFIPCSTIAAVSIDPTDYHQYSQEEFVMEIPKKKPGRPRVDA